MARRVFGGDDVEVRTGAEPILVAGGVAEVYLDAAGTLPATDLTDMADAPITLAQLAITPHSQLPLFKGPNDNRDTLWVRVQGGPVTPIYARADDRLDQLEADVAALGGAQVSSVDGLTGAVNLTGTYRKITDAENLYAKKTETPTLDELTFTNFIGSVTFGTTARVDWNAAFSASLWVAPFDMQVISAHFSFDFWTLTGSDTNWWNLILRRYRNNVSADIATRQTRITGGTNGIAGRTGYNFNTVPFDPVNSVFQQGDVCVMAFTFNGTPANLLLPCTITTRWRPL